MQLQHVKLRFFARITEHALKHHRHVTHEINRIVVHHDLPRHIEFFFALRFLFPDRGFHRRRRSFFELHGADRAHEKCYHTVSAVQTVAVARILRWTTRILRALAALRSSKPCKWSNPWTTYKRNSRSKAFPNRRALRRALSTPTKISPCWKVITSVGPDSFMNCRCNDAIFRSETIKTEISRSWARSVFFLRGKRRQSSAAFRANISRSTTCTGTLRWRLRTVISGIGAIASRIGLSELDRLNRSSFRSGPVVIEFLEHRVDHFRSRHLPAGGDRTAQRLTPNRLDLQGASRFPILQRRRFVGAHRFRALHVFTPGITRKRVAAFLGCGDHFVHQCEHRLSQIFVANDCGGVDSAP